MGAVASPTIAKKAKERQLCTGAAETEQAGESSGRPGSARCSQNEGED